MKTITTNELTASKFSVCACEIAPDILQGMSPNEFLLSQYQKGCFFGLVELQRSGFYKIAGWKYDFRPFMSQFVVKQYDSWQEYYAPNKTRLRKSIYGRIQKIVPSN